VSPIQKTDPTRHVVLRTFPCVVREAAHEDFAFASGERANPCVYSVGEVLFSDSPVIMARLQELAKKSTDTLVNEGGQLSLNLSPAKTIGEQELVPLRGIEKLVAIHNPPAKLTVQSAPNSPKGQFMKT
jgi:hypothetical protein